MENFLFCAVFDIWDDTDINKFSLLTNKLSLVRYNQYLLMLEKIGKQDVRDEAKEYTKVAATIY